MQGASGMWFQDAIELKSNHSLQRSSDSQKPKRKVARKPVRLYEDWTEKKLMNRASVMGIEGWASMTREELIHALREA